MIKIFIIDDEKPAISKLRYLLKEYEDIQICGEYTLPGELLKDVERLYPDILFLDIEMPGISGIDLAEQIARIHPRAEIVFVTAFDRYAVEAFEVNAVDYLLKPVIRERLDKTISRIRSRRKENPGDLKEEHHKAVASGMVCCFGRLGILTHEGQWFSSWRSAKVRELLGFYVHHRGTELHRSKIIEAIWPEMDYDRALKNFNTCNYQLKRQLAQLKCDLYVRYANAYYRLDMGSYCCDVDMLSQVAAQCGQINTGNLVEIISAIQAYRGMYLENIECTWVDFERDHYERLCIESEIGVARYMLAQSRYDDSIDYASRVLEKNRVQEEAWRILLKALETKGDQLAYKKQYEMMRSAFQEELDMDIDMTL